MKNKLIKICTINFIVLLLLNFIFCADVYSQENQGKNVRVVKENAVLKLQPRNDSTIIKKIPPGSELYVEETLGDWLKIKLPPDEDGIVIIGYISQYDVEWLSEKAEIKKAGDEKPIVSYTPKKEVIKEEKELTPKIGIGFEAGYAVPSNNEHGGGVKLGGNLFIGINKNIAIELSGINFHGVVKKDTASLSKGNLSIIPIQLSIQGRFPIKKTMVFYILGGGSYFLNKFTLDNDIVSSWNSMGFEIKEKIENAMGFHMGAGIDLFVKKNLAINIDLRYLINTPNGTWVMTDQISGAEVSDSFKKIRKIEIVPEQEVRIIKGN